MASENIFHCLKIGHIVKQTIKIISTLVFFASILYGFHKYIQFTVKSLIEDESFIYNLSAQIRPFIVFDQNGSILMDQGGMRHIDKIDVLIQQNKDKRPYQVIVSPRQYLSYPPFLTSITENEYYITSRRGKRYDWIFDLKIRSFMENTGDMFRIEILK